MPLLKFLKLNSCHSLKSLPDSFVRLKMLESLIIINCTKFSTLPDDFGRLKCLNYMTVEDCQLLKELPRGFGALPALKTFSLIYCNSFVDLPRDFPESASLENLRLNRLPFLSRLPDGFGKLRKLRFLSLYGCDRLETLSDDFEKMASLERLVIEGCYKLEGPMMEKILKLQNCVKTDILCSGKLLEKWKQMQREIECPITVFSGDEQIDNEEEKRAIRVALSHGKCVEINITTGQLVERSSVLVGLEKGRTVTVALIILHSYLQSSPTDDMVQRFVEIAREKAKTNGSGMLQIVCAREYGWTDQTPTITEEEEQIHQILRSLPKGSCALSKRVSLPRHDNSKTFFVGQFVVNMEGRKSFENFEVVGRGDMFWKPPPSEIPKQENKQYNSIQNFIESICYKQSQSPSVPGQSKTREFIEILKGNGIDHLLVEGQKLMVDDLHGKTIGLVICKFKLFEYIKLEQIFKDVQQKDSNFVAIWIREGWSLQFEDACGLGSHIRLTQCGPWATFPHQMDTITIPSPSFALLDKGHITIQNVKLAWDLLVGWGGKLYPFTQHTIRESFFLMESDSCLEFLLHGMDIVGRKPMKSRITFLYAKYLCKYARDRQYRTILPYSTEYRSECQNMTFNLEELTHKLEELTHFHGNFEVLYVADVSNNMSNHIGYSDFYDIDNLKQDYEDTMQDMHWPSLSFLDSIMFWRRCKFLASVECYELYKESNIMMEKTLHELAKHLVNDNPSLVLMDKIGVVTINGKDVAEMICDSSDDTSDGEGRIKRRVKDELMKSLSSGECSPLVRTLFRNKEFRPLVTRLFRKKEVNKFYHLHQQSMEL